MVGEIVYEKPPIFQLRELNAGWMNKLTDGVKSFIDSHHFYPSVFYNENDFRTGLLISSGMFLMNTVEVGNCSQDCYPQQCRA